VAKKEQKSKVVTSALLINSVFLLLFGLIAKSRLEVRENQRSILRLLGERKKINKNFISENNIPAEREGEQKRERDVAIIIN
jgi:hypothetical protein